MITKRDREKDTKERMERQREIKIEEGWRERKRQK
jgi:hypothetical protein